MVPAVGGAGVECVAQGPSARRFGLRFAVGASEQCRAVLADSGFGVSQYQIQCLGNVSLGEFQPHLVVGEFLWEIETAS
jgi:hypothetical protein